ncbi:cysteine synthase family protein [Bacillus pseudomycoides]|uniref:cysteine synthase family protein n=1 Tax=Bacillus pseudomycoides TaxID=64104 RepID=UPI000BEBC32F|nr:cysteine synthase family protein [Bacillus pseudomycoides]PEE44041.1 pyridoxal-5'-phosphate-dependent protein [Bacillus pseudomycoides]PEI87009.1 pyridoxal-5'-phosphate-dependent protein [Bacillus pseudomycoides]PGA85261.1 pyridoxal-5'-phosphate-dependent protein [Bacillus pseudomycoides]PHF34280.1 pyridoxal-5'-phosphate-dependent protein [Bacillus pseudomycoides]
MLAENIIQAIGKTPLVKLQLDQDSIGSVYAKLESMNPFGMKDRVAKQIVIKAKKQGILPDGVPIIESSSGTMALGIALVGTYLGHPVHIVTDPRIDPITLSKLNAMGCKVHIVEKMTSQGWQSARLEKLSELMKDYPGAFWPRQYENPENPSAYSGLANELIEDLHHVDVLIGSIGSGGSLCGTAKELRKKNPNLHVVAVDCVGSVLFGQPDQPHRLQGGLGNSLIPPNLDHSIINEIHWLNDEEAFSATLELAHKEKIFAGNSSGSVYAVSRWFSHKVSKESKIVAIFPDRGDRYFNTIFNEKYLLEKDIDVFSLPENTGEVPYGSVVKSWSFATLKGEERNAEHTFIY